MLFISIIHIIAHGMRATEPIDMQAFVDEINAKQNSWIAAVHHHNFTGGSYMSEPWSNFTSLNIHHDDDVGQHVKYTAIPSEFDAREKFKSCAGIIGHVWSQGNCASCASIAAIGPLNDRLCIKKGFQELLSVAYPVSCCVPENGCVTSHGCGGGNTWEIMNFAHRFGIPSGGEFREGAMTEADGCWPYFLPKCTVVGDSKKYPACPETPPLLPACHSVCRNTAYTTPLASDRHFVAAPGAILIGGSIDRIKREIYTNGSVTATFQVYEDFLHYKSGIYTYTQGNYVTFHSIKLIGWGKSKSAGDYWLAVNSWNDDWGEDGLFRIAMGQCMVEDFIIYGNPL